MTRLIFCAALICSWLFASWTAGKDAPASRPQGILGVPDGWELVKKAEYAASQTPGDVTIVARGKHPTGGYETKLVESPLKIWPPQYLLVCKKPDGPATQVISPFEAKATFKAKEPVKKVVVSDAAGKHEVKVDQARD
jgi:hypothetical protein